jgi:hypothetical protein
VSRATALGALLSAIALALGVLGAAALPVALGAGIDEAPKVAITRPADGSFVNDTTPVISGTTSDHPIGEFPGEEGLGLGEDVEVSVALEGGGPVQSKKAAPGSDGAWSTALEGPLPAGTYRVVATQQGAGGQGFAERTFTVDTTPPSVSMSSPLDGSSISGGDVAVAGSAGTASGDLPTITIKLYPGSSIASATPLETLQLQASGGRWSGALGGLAPGTYTVQAAQQDAAGNVAVGPPATFTVNAAGTPPGPLASFVWVPSAPAVGESVSLVSSSTDSESPLTGFAWSLAPTGTFSPGKPVLTTSFSTPGAHVVRLRVTDASGRSTVATETVPVRAHLTPLMAPFPVVRIAGSITGNGAQIRLLTVQAPVAARVTILCRGHGCQTKSESRLAKASSLGKRRPAAVVLAFRRFERSYSAGAVLTILVARGGEIGKYTTFRIRRHKLPIREDACILAGRAKPIPCAPA